MIGRYQRNYDRFFNTFAPFKRNGRDYALYSPDYTCTRVMSLPDCKDVGGEAPDDGGFCPVDYFVPDESRVGDLAGRFGFMYGCHWGCPYQVQFLDLTRVEEGIVVRSDLLIGCIDSQRRRHTPRGLIEIRRNNAGGLELPTPMRPRLPSGASDGSVVPNAF